jgi:hypothetical protein
MKKNKYKYLLEMPEKLYVKGHKSAWKVDVSLAELIRSFLLNDKAISLVQEEIKKRVDTHKQ